MVGGEGRYCLGARARAPRGRRDIRGRTEVGFTTERGSVMSGLRLGRASVASLGRQYAGRQMVQRPCRDSGHVGGERDAHGFERPGRSRRWRCWMKDPSVMCVSKQSG